MKKTLIIITILFLFQKLTAEIIIFKNCSGEEYRYEKNDYTINLKKQLVTRDFIYSDETYKRLRLNDARVKKENSNTKKITKVDGQIISEISGYPAFYTQRIFDSFDKSIKIRSVLNNTEGISVISKCKKIIKYKLES